MLQNGVRAMLRCCVVLSTLLDGLDGPAPAAFTTYHSSTYVHSWIPAFPGLLLDIEPAPAPPKAGTSPLNTLLPSPALPLVPLLGGAFLTAVSTVLLPCVPPASPLPPLKETLLPHPFGETICVQRCLSVLKR